MTTYFVWVDDDEVFNPNIHKRNDLDIFKLDISQREGEVATARALVASYNYIPPVGKKLFISYEFNGQHTLIFKGQLCSIPIRATQYCLFLEFLALPDDMNTYMQNAIDGLRTDPAFDPLFYDEAQGQDLSALMEAKSAFCYWDRRGGQSGFSDLFFGRYQIDLSDWVLEDGFKITYTQKPLDQVVINVQCEWLQDCWGILNLSPKINHYFNNGYICTLTPQDLEKRWPRPGLPLARSGYTVLESSLKRVDPPKTIGIKGSKEIFTPALKALCDRTKKTKYVWLEKAFYKAKLVVGWNFQQKRKETAQIIVRQNNDWQKGALKQRIVHLNLQNVFGASEGPMTQGSFFDTSRGMAAISYAIEIAKSHLAASSRCVEIDFQIPFHKALDVTTDTSVVLEGDWIPGSYVKGKVTAYGLCQEGLNQWAWIKMQACAGAKQSDQTMAGGWCPPKTTDMKSENDVEDLQKIDTRFDLSDQGLNLKITTGSADEPTIDFSSLTDQSSETFIDNLEIFGHGDSQWETLVEHQHKTVDDMRAILRQNPTGFCLKLKDIRTKDVMEKKYVVEVLNEWVAPNQICFQGQS